MIAGMQFGIILTTGDARQCAEMAAEAEAAGWDAVFTYEVLAIGADDHDRYDPWITLTAMAMTTSRIRLGAMVFAPSRRRPWKLAREAITLDCLSGGRLVLPVGMGTLDDAGFANVGEPVDARVRGELLTETLEILDGLSSGKSFSYAGDHYRFGPMTFRPRPVQRPRVPIWVVGAWPHVKSMRRAARWDGVVVQGADAAGNPSNAPANLSEIVGWLQAERLRSGLDGAFDVVVGGVTPFGSADADAAAAAVLAPLAAAGATWWAEGDWSDVSLGALRARIAAGPPRVRSGDAGDAGAASDAGGGAG